MTRFQASILGFMMTVLSIVATLRGHDPNVAATYWVAAAIFYSVAARSHA